MAAERAIDVLRRTVAHSPARARGAELQALLERVYDASFDSVYGMAYAATGNHADAEDVTAETYERAVRKIASFRGSEDRMIGWIFGIARNVVREYRRDRDRSHVPLEEHHVEAATSFAHRSEVEMDTQRLLESLSPAQREVLALRLAGLKLREVAEVVGKAEGTVKALQFAAMQRLRTVADE